MVGQPGGSTVGINTNLTLYPGYSDGAPMWWPRGAARGGGTAGYITNHPSEGGPGHALNVGAYGLARFGAGCHWRPRLWQSLQRNSLDSATGLAASGRGSFSNDALGGRVEIGWRGQFGAVSVTPFAALEVDHLWQGSFAESTLAFPARAGWRFGSTGPRRRRGR